MSFDIEALTWDKKHRLERGKHIADAIAQQIEHRGHGMEFGAGTGIISFFLNDYFESITAIDSSKGMIDQLATKVASTDGVNILPVKTDLLLEQHDEKYDVIFHSLVLHHIEDIQKIHDKFYELLKPGGKLIFVDLNTEDGSFHAKYPDFDGHLGFDQASLKSLIEQRGFKNIHSETIYHGEKSYENQTSKYSLFLMSAKK